MNEYLITASSKEINFGATGVEEILQNVRMILSTPQLSVPLDRAFGVDSTVIDKPLPIAKSRIAVEITDAIRKYEPRAAITGIEFSGDGLTGKLVPKVKVRIL